MKDREAKEPNDKRDYRGGKFEAVLLEGEILTLILNKNKRNEELRQLYII
jgi:hypothetical protein